MAVQKVSVRCCIAGGGPAGIMRVLDRINADMGTGTLRYAAEGYVKRWRTRFKRRSPVNTTNWRDLPVAKAS